MFELGRCARGRRGHKPRVSQGRPLTDVVGPNAKRHKEGQEDGADEDCIRAGARAQALRLLHSISSLRNLLIAVVSGRELLRGASACTAQAPAQPARRYQAVDGRSRAARRSVPLTPCYLCVHHLRSAALARRGASLNLCSAGRVRLGMRPCRAINIPGERAQTGGRGKQCLGIGECSLKDAHAPPAGLLPRRRNASCAQSPFYHFSPGFQCYAT